VTFDKESLFRERGYRCECGCGKLAQDAHHALIGRRKRFPELDCPENILLVNHDEHLLRKFDNIEWRRYFWQVQIDRYGYDHMMNWVNALPSKLRHRLDFLNCGRACGYQEPYGFVPEDGCPVHDKYPKRK